MSILESNTTPYTYLFVRKDLSNVQRIVQTAHAAHRAGDAFGEHSHITLLGIQNQEALLNAAKYLEQCEIDYEMFYEPDGQVGYTAIATQPLVGETRKHLRRFSLLKD